MKIDKSKIGKLVAVRTIDGILIRGIVMDVTNNSVTLLPPDTTEITIQFDNLRNVA